jgi:hypothetical protein
MTIHWKALEEYFLMVPLVLGLNQLANATWMKCINEI